MRDDRSAEPPEDTTGNQRDARRNGSPGGGGRGRGVPEAEPDVLLDVPQVRVERIRLGVHGLDADLSLRARLANLLQVDAGVRVHLERVDLDIEGVEAAAMLKVRLDELTRILERALTTIDRNPQILSHAVGGLVDELNQTTRQAVRELDGTAAQALGRHGPVTPAVDRPRPPVEGPVEPLVGPGIERPAEPAGRAGGGQAAGSADRPATSGTGRPAAEPGTRQQAAPVSAGRVSEMAGEALRVAGSFLRNAAREAGLSPPSTGGRRSTQERKSPARERESSAQERPAPGPKPSTDGPEEVSRDVR
ncbi:hypothetical protein ABNF97_25735 [Plantactinospora sp. B6F1]|uniref:hypothetical protein n=1 Tax=Plantactinospora sp. B6F1 TaxID=3158971 RepID=UPI00102B5055